MTNYTRKTLSLTFSFPRSLTKLQTLLLAGLFILSLSLPISIQVFKSQALATSLTLPATPPTPVTPPSIKNNKPIIKGHLEKAKVGHLYFADINGFDRNLDDQLQMTISNLPQNFEQTDCQTTIVKNKLNITCTIFGIPTQTGRYDILVTLQDNQGSEVQKTLKLQIRD